MIEYSTFITMALARMLSQRYIDKPCPKCGEKNALEHLGTKKWEQVPFTENLWVWTSQCKCKHCKAEFKDFLIHLQEIIESSQ